jgi:hypothetical protein
MGKVCKLDITEGRTSYPHWPPTSHEEADLFDNCFLETRGHPDHVSYVIKLAAV